MTDRQHSDDLDLLAAEYALGLLDGADWTRAHSLAENDPVFAKRVRDWQSEGAEWLLEIEPVTPPDRVWERLEPLFEGTQKSRVDLSQRGSSAVGSRHRELRKWQGRAYFAMAASLVLAVGLGWLAITPGTPQPSPVPDAGRLAVLNLAVAQIADSAGEPLVTAVFDPESRELWVDAASVSEEGKALELWALDSTGKPFSLGIVEERNQKRKLDPALGAILARDRFIAVTIEDRATAPHSAPTQAVLGTAKLKVL